MQSPRPLRPDAPVQLPALGGVGVVAPLGRDARLVADRLRSTGLTAQACLDMDALCDGVEAGQFSALVLTSETLDGSEATRRLRGLLQAQPSWSDLPVLVLGAPGGETQARRLLGQLGSQPSATVLERPVPQSVLVAAVRLALFGRQRQLEVRDVLQEIQRAKATLEERVEARTYEVRQLASELTLAEHAERRRIAYLLHDDLQQRLHGLSITLELLGRSLPAGDSAQTTGLIEKAKETLNGATGLTRALSHDLAPPILEGEGISELLDWVANRARERYGLDVEVEARDHVAVAREDIRVLLSQLLGELLLNVVKHADVSHVHLTALQVPERSTVRVTVEDEGSGFDARALDGSRTRLGLASVRERTELVGGRVLIESVPGAGTRATVEVPSGERLVA